jgi:hypothetical protein
MARTNPVTGSAVGDGERDGEAAGVAGTVVAPGAGVLAAAAAPVSPLVPDGPPPHALNDTATRMVATTARLGAR